MELACLMATRRGARGRRASHQTSPSGRMSLAIKLDGRPFELVVGTPLALGRELLACVLGRGVKPRVSLTAAGRTLLGGTGPA